ncbi:Phosphoglycerate mutase [Aphelenchoides besseyi]|nr:Phosphoglycerate mutase [Aphelenchoides besseyi]
MYSIDFKPQGFDKMSDDRSKNKVCLVVIDGWGLREEEHGNAIHHAKTPVMDELCSGNWTQLEAHGQHVGLHKGLMGNSEVGHLNIGAGRVMSQDIVRIDNSIEENTLIKNPELVSATNRAIENGGRLHLCGLVSDGGVHSHIKHLFALLKVAKELKVPHVYIHFFGDGRDTSPTSGVNYLQQLLDYIKELGYGELATIVGRYYAMDRDTRWERTRVAYDALVANVGEACTIDKAVEVVKSRYAKDQTDEFLEPIVFGEESRIKDNDTILFFNYRADRMRQISETFGGERWKTLESKHNHPKNLKVFGMTQYKKEFNLPCLFPPASTDNVLAEWLSKKNVTQFHCAETEKYAHVTFFFNGGREVTFDGEERCMVPSPKEVGTYDQKPEMNAAGVGEKMVEQVKLGKHRFIMCNFAPPDMVGHTGVYEAAVKACEATDTAIGQVYEACKKHDYILMVTADHGNAEQMIAEDGGKFTAHTCYKVPFTCSSDKYKLKTSLSDRSLALRDVAPTVLDLLGLDIPSEMTGVSLVA